MAASAPDVLATDGTCSLREAIINANGDAATWPDCPTGSGADTIVLPAGNYVLAIPPGTGEDAAATGDLNVLDDLTLVGAGPAITTIDAAGLDRVLDVRSSASIRDLTITGGVAPGASWGDGTGGGIQAIFASLSLRNITVSGNSAGWGGGLFLFLGSLQARSVVVSGNNADDGGGIYAVPLPDSESTIESSAIHGNQALYQGGGVYVEGRMMLVDTSVFDNVADGQGGGVYNSGGTLRLLNASVSRNLGAGVATSWHCGGCIGLGQCPCGGGDASIQNSTVSENFGGGIANEGGHVTLDGSVIADQVSGADCANGSSGFIASGGHNLDSDGSCDLTDPTDLPNTDPMLGPLQDNGGPTFIHALLPGSPAIDAIPVADCSYDDDGDPGTPDVPLTEDQRGVVRPQGDGCDMGAYEVTACADGIDNDGDAFVDAADPGCRDAASVREDPHCQDGINNDPAQDDLIDFDGGLSALGYVATDPDPQCVGKPWQNREKRGTRVCGLGAELALLLPALIWLRCRSRGSKSATASP